MDYRGEVYSLSRWTGQKPKALTGKLGDPAGLPDMEEVKARIAARMTDKLKGFIRESEARADAAAKEAQDRKAVMRERQRAARRELAQRLAERSEREALARAARFRKGVLGLWDRVSGRTGKIRKQNEREAQKAALRDARERDALVAGQLSERRGLQQDLRRFKQEAAREAEELRRDIAFYMGLRRQSAERADAPQRSRSRERSPSRIPLHR